MARRSCAVRTASRCSSASDTGVTMAACSCGPTFSNSTVTNLRREPLERRKAALEKLLRRTGHGVQLNEHLEAEGPLVFERACRMGLEGIVSKRKGSWYHSGRSRAVVRWLNSVPKRSGR